MNRGLPFPAKNSDSVGCRVSGILASWRLGARQRAPSSEQIGAAGPISRRTLSFVFDMIRDIVISNSLQAPLCH